MRTYSTPDGVWRWINGEWGIRGLERDQAFAFARDSRELNNLKEIEIVMDNLSSPPDGYYVYDKFKWVQTENWEYTPSKLNQIRLNQIPDSQLLQKHLDLEIEILIDDFSRTQIRLIDLAELRYHESVEFKKLLNSKKQSNPRELIEFIRSTIFFPSHLCDRLRLNYDRDLDKIELNGRFWVSKEVWEIHDSHPKMDDYRKMCNPKWREPDPEPDGGLRKFSEASKSTSSGNEVYTRPRGFNKNRR
jgi:hypothetical protein